MKRRQLCIALLPATMAFGSVMAEDDVAPVPARLVLRVQVEKVEATPFYPKPDQDCPAGQACIVWAYWTKYRARVIEVVQGAWPNDGIEFLRLEHSQFVGELLRDCYVALQPSGSKLRDTLALDWVATELVSERFGGGERIKALREGR